MSKARMEILRLVAEGKISPEEGDRMLAALEGEASEDHEATSKGWAEGISQSLRDFADSVRRTVDDAIATTQRAFEEHRAETETVETVGGSFSLEAGARLKIQHAVRVSFGGSSKGSHLFIRAGDSDHVRIIRGQAIEVHRNGTDYVLTWAKGNLELEVPVHLSTLDVRCMGGDLEIQKFPGPMSLETMGGELRIASPRAPFRCRTLGGKARIVDLLLDEGNASISSTGGDVHVDLAPRASITVRATTLGGEIVFPPGTGRDVHGKARRHAISVVGEGSGTLTIDTLGGDVRVRLPEDVGGKRQV